MTDRALGRLVAEDPRDRTFRMAAVLPPKPQRRYRYYWSSWFGDQGSESSCVGYAWTHWLHSGPTTQTGFDWEVYAGYAYRRAQTLDEWPGEGYEGTSVRAGAKFLQSEGLLSEYRWAWSYGEIVRAVLDVGPVTIGIPWYESMNYPDYAGRFPDIGGEMQGGHAVLVDGANLDTQMVRVKNSWSRAWGDKGRFWLTFSQLEFLLQHDGEACLAVEVAR